MTMPAIAPPDSADLREMRTPGSAVLVESGALLAIFVEVPDDVVADVWEEVDEPETCGVPEFEPAVVVGLAGPEEVVALAKGPEGAAMFTTSSLH